MTQRRHKQLSSIQLMTMTLPVSPVADWALDIGTLPSPRKAWITACGSGHVTTVSASKPTTSIHSFVGVLIGYKANIASEIEHRHHGDTSILSPPYLKTKLDLVDYVTHHRMHEGEDDGEDDEAAENESHDITNDVSVARGELEDYISSARPCDVVFVGQDDGYVACWGVSRPADASIAGRNNIWYPMLAIKNSHNPVTAIAYEDSTGLLLVADVAGKILVWEVYETTSNVGYLQYQRALLKSLQKKSVNEENLAVEDDGTSSQASFESNNLDESAILASFKPNSIRHAITFDIPFASITTMKIIPEYMMIVIGTVNGATFTIALYNRNPAPIAVNLSSFGIRESVAGITFSYYFRQETIEYVPAVYLSFESNIIVVFHLISHEILAYCGSPMDITSVATAKTTVVEENEDEEGEEEHSEYSDMTQTNTSTAYACVLDAADNLFIPPSSIVPAEIISTCKRPSPEEREKAILRKSVFAMFSSSSSETSSSANTATSATIETRRASNATVPQDPASFILPHKLILLSGRRLLSYNILKFTPPKKSGANTITAANTSIVNSKIISTTDIISGNLVSYIEEASRAWSEPLPCLLIANCEGGVFALRLKDKSSVGYINLFEGILLRPIKFSSGIVLQNGVCYFSDHNRTIYSARASSITHILSQPLPTRGIVSSFYSTHSRLSTGRESRVAATLGAASKKKRQSTLGLTASVTDLEKIFSKTKDQRAKDDLLGTRDRNLSVISDHSSDSDSNSIQNVKQDVRGVTNTMAEARQALEERGEKLEQLAKQSDDLKNVARDFQQNAKAQKDVMKQKNSRWGLF
jgi:hypothetical protein